MSEKTPGEILFEEYLHAAGVRDYAFEAEFPGSPQRPDYSFPHGGTTVLLDVKDFVGEAKDFNSGFSSYDPYEPIRAKIEEGRRKFKNLKGHPCGLVLYNHGKPLVSLRPMFVYGAMLGNLSFKIPISGLETKRKSSETQMIFGSGGKMIRSSRDQRPLAPQNTTISAVIALGRLLTGQKSCKKWLDEEEAARGRKFTFEETLKVLESWQGTERDISQSQLRVIVYENPYARIPWPSGLFTGPWDERYGVVDGGYIRRLFAGHSRIELEQLIGKAPDFSA